MTETEAIRRRPIARQRSIYCSPEDRNSIGRRAKAAGMSFSRFMVVCAVHCAGEDDGGEDPRLVLNENEQRMLFERVGLLDRCSHALLERLPGTEMSALGALVFLAREARGRADEGGGEGE